MFSITLVVVAALAIVLVGGAVLAVFATARGGAEADASLARRVTVGRAARTSGDIHLFVRYPEARANELLAAIAPLEVEGRIPGEALATAIGRLHAALEAATDAHASYSHFHFIRCRRDDRPGKTIYIAVRSRVAVETVDDPSDREAVGRALAAIAALPTEAVVTALVAEAESDRDPASPTLVPLRSAAPSA